MILESVPLATLHADPANVRRHPERNLDAIKASLARFGQQKPIVVDASGIVRAGNGTLEAARALGWNEVAIVRTPLKGSEATAYAIADNRTADLAEWDDVSLAETLRALQSEDFDLNAVGFTDEEVDELLDGLADEMLDAAESEERRTEGLIFSDEQITEAAFAYFRRAGFPYRDLPAWECMKQINKLAETDSGSLLQTVAAYQVADTYNPHRFHSAAEGMRSPFDSFQDDAALRKAIRLALENGKDVETVLWVVNGTQACANFRPGFACKLYRDYCRPGDTVLDTSTGYGGRLVGFMASGVAGKYIGIDPNTKTHDGNLRMAAELGFADKVELYNLPAEDVSHGIVADRCDFAFTSPPYFRKEHYSDEPTQSWKRYQTGGAWRDGFLVPMLRLQFAALKPGKTAIVNIADVEIKNQVYPLTEWTIEQAKAVGFDHVRTDEFPMQRRFGAGHDGEVATEPVIVLRKPALSNAFGQPIGQA